MKLNPFFQQFNKSYKTFMESSQVIIAIIIKHLDRVTPNIGPNDQTVLAKLVRQCGSESVYPRTMVRDSFFAGVDSTSFNATLLLYHLACHPDKQERLYQEICQRVGADGRITAAHLDKMNYLKACLKESQRMVPSAIFRKRSTQVGMLKDMELFSDWSKKIPSFR